MKIEDKSSRSTSSTSTSSSSEVDIGAEVQLGKVEIVVEPKLLEIKY